MATVTSPRAPGEEPLTALVAACEEQTRRFRSGVASDARFCLEIVRRAMAAAMAGPAASQDPAWEAVVRIYTPYVHAQVSRNHRVWAEIADFTQQVWLRFFQAARGGLAFPSLEGYLTYLKRVVVTALIELTRRQHLRQTREQPLPTRAADDAEGLLPAEGPAPFDLQIQRLVFARCRERIPDADDWRIFMLRYALGYPPREIAARLAAMGMMVGPHAPTPRRVSDLLERLLRRLREDPELRELSDGD